MGPHLSDITRFSEGLLVNMCLVVPSCLAPRTHLHLGSNIKQKYDHVDVAVRALPILKARPCSWDPRYHVACSTSCVPETPAFCSVLLAPTRYTCKPCRLPVYTQCCHYAIGALPLLMAYPHSWTPRSENGCLALRPTLTHCCGCWQTATASGCGCFKKWRVALQRPSGGPSRSTRHCRRDRCRYARGMWGWGRSNKGSGAAKGWACALPCLSGGRSQSTCHCKMGRSRYASGSQDYQRRTKGSRSTCVLWNLSGGLHLSKEKGIRRVGRADFIWWPQHASFRRGP